MKIARPVRAALPKAPAYAPSHDLPPLRLTAAALALAALLASGCAQAPQPQSGLERIEHIVVIYAENCSFDHLYGLFSGAEGIAQATATQKTQLDHDGKPLPTLPPVYEGGRASALYHRCAQRPFPNRPTALQPAPG